MKITYFFLLVFLSFSFFNINSVHSQEKKGMNFHLEKALTNTSTHRGDSKLSMLVKGDEELIKNYVTQNGGTVKYSINGISAISLPASKVRDFSAQTQNLKVSRIEYNGAKGTPLNDVMINNINVDSIHKGLGELCSSYDGAGVVLGFIDTGIDFNHPDFKDSTGKTRIQYIWDQTVAGTNKPQPYNYGQEWTAANIDAGTCTHVDNFAGAPSHGTHVSGIGAGNGLATGKYKGVAPNTDIIVVATDFNANDWTGTVADAVDYIFKKADALGKPCVINTSVGTSSGSHDGKDLAAQTIDGLITAKNGRALVAASGNNGDKRHHLGYNVTSDTSFTWFTFNSGLNFGPYAPAGAVFFEVYADTADFNNVNFSMGVDKTSPYYKFRGRTNFVNIKNRLNNIFSDSIFNQAGNPLGIMHTWAEENDGVYLLQVIVNPDSTSGYSWRFSTTGSGKFDVWADANLIGGSSFKATIPSAATFPEIVNYKSPDYNQTLQSSWQCSPNVITVGNYHNRNSFESYGGLVNYGEAPGSIRPSSSAGPTRTGLTKPDVAAPGSYVLSAGSLTNLATWKTSNPTKVSDDGMHFIEKGTSMASPMVAGIVALYLQKKPTASYAEIRNSINATAKQDSYTGSAPNNTWGYGKVDGLSALEMGGTPPKPAANIQKASINCTGKDIALNGNPSAGSGVYSSHLWLGDTTYLSSISAANVFLSSSDTVQVNLIYQVTDANGCVAIDSVVINIKESPIADINVSATACTDEVVTLTTNVLGGAEPYIHGWSGDVLSIDNTSAQSPDFNSSVSGDFTLFYMVTDSVGCTGTDSLVITINESPSPPQVGYDTSYCAGDSIVDIIAIASMGGNLNWYLNPNLLTSEGISESFTPSNTIGQTTYYVTETSNGCVSASSQVEITINTTPIADMGIFPMFCVGELININGNPNGGTSIYVSHQWTGDTEKLNSTSSEDVIFNADESGYYNLTYTVMDDFGCKGSDSKVVEVKALPIANVIGGGNICEGDSIEIIFDFGGEPPFDFNYSDGVDSFNEIINESTYSIFANSTKTYTLKDVYDLYCFADSINVTVNVQENPIPLAPTTQGEGVYCEGDSIADLVAIDNLGGDLTWYSDSNLLNVIQTGSVLSPLNINGTSIYYVNEVANGCIGDVSSIDVIINSGPLKPNVSLDNNVLNTDVIINNYQWYLDGNPIASGKNQNYTATEDGNYYLLVTDSNGCSAMSDTVNVLLSSIEGQKQIINFNAYPNPFEGRITLEFGEISSDNTMVSILDILGKVVYQKKLEKKSGNSTLQIVLTQESKGIYFIKLDNGSSVKIKKIVNK